MNEIALDAIITHDGAAHRDDFLATAIMLAAAENTEIPIIRERLKAEDTRFTDPRVAILDQGGRCEPELLNLDHHQLPYSPNNPCTINLVLDVLGLLSLAEDVFPWLGFSARLDNSGPFKTAEFLGIDKAAFTTTVSPVETAILHMFGAERHIKPRSPMHNLLLEIGQGKLNHLLLVGKRIDFLYANFTLMLHPISMLKPEGPYLLDTRMIASKDRPATGIDVFLKKHAPHKYIPVTVSWDDSSDGITLFRRNDDPRVNFNAIRELPGVSFVHNSGFIAKVDKTADVLALVRASIEL